MTQDENLRQAWDESLSFLFAGAFMNNCRTDSSDRNRFFNFQFPRYQEKTRAAYLSKYDYFRIPPALLDDGLLAGESDAISNPEDDISSEEDPQARRPGLSKESFLLDKNILDELDDIDQILEQQASHPKPLELIELNPRTPAQSPPKRLDHKDKKREASEKQAEANTDPRRPQEPVQVTEAELDELLEEYLAMNIDI